MVKVDLPELRLHFGFLNFHTSRRGRLLLSPGSLSRPTDNEKTKDVIRLTQDRIIE